MTDFVFQDPTGGRHFFGMAAMINLDGGCTYAPVSTMPGGRGRFVLCRGYAPPAAGLVLVLDRVTGTAYSFSVSPQALSAVACVCGRPQREPGHAERLIRPRQRSPTRWDGPSRWGVEAPKPSSVPGLSCL